MTTETSNPGRIDADLEAYRQLEDRVKKAAKARIMEFFEGFDLERQGEEDRGLIKLKTERTTLERREGNLEREIVCQSGVFCQPLR